MSKQIPVEAFMTAFGTLLEETFERVHGAYLDRGTSLFETLETITSEEASRPVSPQTASIAAHVEHLRIYIELAISYVHGEAVGPVDWSATWRLTEVTPDEWVVLKERLRATHRDLLAIARDPTTWEIENALGGAMALLAHTAYHLGEIRQAIGTVRT